MLTACAFIVAARAHAEEPVPAPELKAPPVIFVTPRNTEPSLEASLRDALEAQFAGMNATLIFRRFETDLPDLRSQARAAREIAQSLSARAVFWVEASAGQDMLVYLTEPDVERILVRRLQVGSMSDAASAETVSIITRESTAALFAGHTIGMQPVNMEPAPQPPPAPPPAPQPIPTARRPAPKHARPPRSPISVDVGYQGNAYSQQNPWQSGIRLGGRFTSPLGLYAAPFYVFYETIDLGTADLGLVITRHPIGVAGGWSFEESQVALLAELGYVADLVSRRVNREADGVEATSDKTRLVSMVTPRLALGYDFTEHLTAYAAAGIDVAVNNFEFVTQIGTDSQPLLSPYRVRACAGLGVSFRP